MKNKVSVLNDQINNSNKIRIGEGSTVGSVLVAIGYKAAAGNVGVAIGYKTNAGVQGTAIGIMSNATGENSFATGLNFLASGKNSQAIGPQSQSTGFQSIALGNQATAKKNFTMALGSGAIANDVGGLAVGEQAQVSGEYSSAFGGAAKSLGQYSVAVGSLAYIGDAVNAPSQGGTSGGHDISKADDYSLTHPLNQNRYGYSIAIGSLAKAHGHQDIAVGGIAHNNFGTAIGSASIARGNFTTVIGAASNVSGQYATALGYKSLTNKDGALAIGYNSEAVVENSVALGSSSVSSRELTDNKTLGYDPSNQFVRIDNTTNKNSIVLTDEQKAKYLSLSADLDRLNNERKNLEEEYIAIKDELNQLTEPTEPSPDAADDIKQQYTIKKQEYDSQKNEIEKRLNTKKVEIDSKFQEIVNKVPERNKLVSIWSATAAAVSVGDDAMGLTRQIINVAAGSEDTDAVNVAQLKSLAVTGIQFSANDYNKDDSSDNMKAKIIKKQIGGILSIQGRSNKVYSLEDKAIYSSDNLITFNDSGMLRIGMLKAPTFSSIKLGDTNSKVLTVDNGKLNFDGNEVVTTNNFETIFNGLYEFKNGLKTTTENNKTIVSLDKDSLKNDPSFKGDKGADGKSAFDTWKEIPGNENKSAQEFADSLKGADGKSAFDTWKEIPGNENKSPKEFADSLKGANGKSVKATVTNNSDGTHTLEVTNSDNTKTSTKIKDGKNGKSAYEIWRDNGNTGKTEQQFVDSLNANTKLKERVDTIENTVHNHSREIQQNRNAIAQINRDMQKMNKELRAGIAGAIAIGSLYQNTIPGKETISAGLGSFKGQNAVAVGYSRLSDNGRVGMKANLSINSSGDAGAGASIGYTW
ncbi:MAG: YadA-like family protein [Haemophilus haemolyticus]|nr:YadA-like family protein [Haemophilus haemolyticus]